MAKVDSALVRQKASRWTLILAPAVATLLIVLAVPIKRHSDREAEINRVLMEALQYEVADQETVNFYDF